MYVLDTNVVSELRRRKPHGAVLEWLQRVVNADIYIASVTVGEIQAGIEVTRPQNVSKAYEIENWLETVAMQYQVLDATAPIFRIWARLTLKTPDSLIEDALIAATALHHNMIVVTRNTRDFSPFGVRLLNPFEPET